jgi:SET domain-containing protein
MSRTTKLQPRKRHERKKPGPRLAIRRSRIDSEGVYTTEPITKGAFVVEYSGPRLTVKQADDLYDGDYQTYLFGLSNGRHVIDGEGVAAFINHSCDPNCEADEIRGRVLINAIRDIKAGEELTYDYSLYNGDLEDEAVCACGSANCRGSMYSEDELRRRARLLRRRQERLKRAS